MLLLSFIFFFYFIQIIIPVFATTLLSEDFSTGTFDSSKWTEIDTTGSGPSTGNIQIQSGQLQAKGNSTWNGNGLRTINSYDRSITDLTIESDVTYTDCSGTTAGIIYGPWVTNSLPTGSIVFNHTTGVFDLWAFDTVVTVSGVSCTNNVPIHVKMVIKAVGGVDVYLNNSVTPNGSLTALQAPNTFTNYPISFQGYASSAILFDNIIISQATVVPDAPTALTTTLDNAQVALSWTAPNDNGSPITDYVVEYKQTADPTWITFNDGVSTNTTTTVTGLTNAINYSFRVSAKNAIGTGNPSNTATSTPNITVPGVPTNLYGIPANGQITLSWNIPASNGGSSITDYVIEYRIGGAAWSTYPDGTSTNTSAVLSGLTNGTTYELRVSAVNGLGTGTTTGTTFVTVGILALSDTFTGTDIDGSKWVETDSATGGSGGTSGNVQYQNNSLVIIGNNNWGTNGLLSVPTFDRASGDISIQVTMSSTSCDSGNTFEFGYGDMNSFTTTVGTTYFVTKNQALWYLMYRNNGVNYVATITGISCTPNIPLTMKLVILQAGGANVYVNGSTTANATLALGTVTNKSIWMQNNSSNASTTFDNLYVVIPTNSPGAPTNLAAFAGDGQVSLTWTAPNNNGSAITDYIVQYRDATSNYNTFLDGVSTSTSATVTGLTNGLTYTFKVSGVNANGTGVASSTVIALPIASTPQKPSVNSVNITGSAAVNDILIGGYTFIDVNGDSEGNSTYRWLSSSSASGVYSQIEGATAKIYAVKQADLNKYIKFEVTPISLFSPTTGTPVLSPASSSIVAAKNYINHILSTGQSLSVGFMGTPALSTTQPYSNVMLSGSSLVPLVESSVETISSAMANSITSKVVGNNYQIAVTIHGQGATAYSGLKKGTTPYQNGMNQMSLVKTATEAQGKAYRVLGVTTIHGESDHQSGNGPYYESYLVEWQHDYETDIKAITGQTEIIPLFTDQMSSQTGYNSATSEIPIAQLSASENNPTKIILVGPKYFLNYVDGGHLTNTSYRWLGEYYGKVIDKVAVNKQEWKPLSPKQVVRNGNVIYAQFNVPEKPIVFDTTLVDLKANYGFEYADDSSSASINSVEIINSDTVKITLNTIPTGTNQKLRYAYTGTPGSIPGAHIAGSVHGNLRDSDSTPSLYGNTLYNWSVQFSKAIVVDSTPPIGGSVSYSDEYYTSPSIALAIFDGTDTSSGINTLTRIVQRKSATLTNGTCGSYGSFETITQSGIYPNFTDSTVTSENCYQYEYQVSDNAGNQATYTSTNIAKVDTEVPTIPGTPSATTASSNNKPNWTWTASIDTVSGFSITPYTLEWSKTSDFSVGVLSSTSNINSYTHTVSLSDGTWYFRVKASDLAGNTSAYSPNGIVVINTTIPVSINNNTSTSPNTLRTILIKVVNSNGNIVVGAKIVLDSGPIAFTDSNGVATFYNVMGTSHNIVISFGNITITKDISLLDVNKDQSDNYAYSFALTENNSSLQSNSSSESTSSVTSNTTSKSTVTNTDSSISPIILVLLGLVFLGGLSAFFFFRQRRIN